MNRVELGLDDEICKFLPSINSKLIKNCTSVSTFIDISSKKFNYCVYKIPSLNTKIRKTAVISIKI